MMWRPKNVDSFPLNCEIKLWCIILFVYRIAPFCSSVSVWISRCCFSERCYTDDWTDTENRWV